MDENWLIAKLNLIAGEIKHEDNLIGQRTTWLVMSQSFLFGAFAVLLAEIDRAGTAPRLARLLLIVVPLVGVLLPALVLLAVSAAVFAIWQWRAERDLIFKMPEAKKLDWPHPEHPVVLVLGQLLPVAAALGFLLAWVYILVQIKKP